MWPVSSACTNLKLHWLRRANEKAAFAEMDENSRARQALPSYLDEADVIKLGRLRTRGPIKIDSMHVLPRLAPGRRYTRHLVLSKKELKTSHAKLDAQCRRLP